VKLDRVQIESPCPVDWESMRGEGPNRFCDRCALTVHDVAGLTRRDAEALIQRPAGRTCLRLTRRHDGKVVTKDSPRWWRWVDRVRAALMFIGVGAGLLATWGCTVVSGGMPCPPEPTVDQTDQESDEEAPKKKPN
jgi:hypothetical protein